MATGVCFSLSLNIQSICLLLSFQLCLPLPGLAFLPSLLFPVPTFPLHSNTLHYSNGLHFTPTSSTTVFPKWTDDETGQSFHSGIQTFKNWFSLPYISPFHVKIKTTNKQIKLKMGALDLGEPVRADNPDLHTS